MLSTTQLGVFLPRLRMCRAPFCGTDVLAWAKWRSMWQMISDDDDVFEFFQGGCFRNQV